MSDIVPPSAFEGRNAANTIHNRLIRYGDQVVGYQGPQLFLVRHTKHASSAKTESITEAWEESGSIELIHMVTQCFCRGYYTTTTLVQGTGRSNTRGVAIFSEFYVSDSHVSPFDGQ